MIKSFNSFPGTSLSLKQKYMWERLKLFINPFDRRYEDLRSKSCYLTVFRDFTAGLIVAMIAIPLAMGFAMASGLKPEQGIVGGAVAGLVGALFGGSKYQVYGPTAAFIPIVAAIMHKYGVTQDGQVAHSSGHGFLVLVAIIAGIILMFMGLFGVGKLVAKVPYSIVVGFTIGIAVTIAVSQIGETFGLHAKLGHGFFHKVQVIWSHIHETNFYAVTLSISTFFIIKYLLKVSIYIPAPLIAIGIATVVSSTLFAGHDLTLIGTKYGHIPTHLLVFTPPIMPQLSLVVIMDIIYYVVAVVFVCSVESLLCSRMADRLADNKGTPFNPDKELWGQGLVNIIVPLLNGFPHTGALARTATNIKVGGTTPLAGIFKCFLKLIMAVYLATYLEHVPMACISGVLMYVAFNMVKPAEVLGVLSHSRFHSTLMIYTALMVIITDFLVGVLSAIIIYAIAFKLFGDLVVPDIRDKQLVEVRGPVRFD